MSKTSNPGLSLAFGSALAFSLLNIGLRFVQDETDITVWGLLLLRGPVALAAALLFSLALKSSPLGRRQNRPLLLLIGLCTFLSNICTITAIAVIPLYQALVLLYLYPAISVPLGFLINGHRASLRDLLLVGLAFAGCLVLLWPDGSAGLELGPGHLIGAINPFFYSASFVLTNRLGEGNKGLEPLFYYGCWALLGNAVIICLLGLNTGISFEQTLAPALGLGLLAVSAILMGYMSLRWLPAFKVGVIGTLEVFVAVLASWLLLSDPLTFRGLIGGAIIMFAALKLRSS